MPTLYLFADSNLFLHYKPFHEIDWSALGPVDRIEIVVCRTVQTEIDSLKHGRDGRRSDRARRAARTFLQIAQHGPIEQRAESPQVVVSLYAEPLPNPDLADRLDYSRNDDSIIGHLAQFKEYNPTFDVRLLTRDSGPVLTANSLDIPYVVARDEWLLDLEPDDKDRKIQELTLQVQALRAREPDFDFSYNRQPTNRLGHVEIHYETFERLNDAEQAQLLQRLQTLHLPTVIDRDRISQQSIEEYEQRDHPAWISRCQEWMQYVHAVVQLERCPEFTISIQNVGTSPATNALVDIRAGGNFQLTAATDALRNMGLFPVMERPTPPAQPQPPPSWSAIWRNTTAFDQFALPKLDLPPLIRDQEDFDYAAEPTLEPETSIRFTCGLWRHSLEPKQFIVRIVPEDFSHRITGEITCTVHAENLAKPAQFKLVVTLSPENRPTLQPALGWFTTPHPDE